MQICWAYSRLCSLALSVPLARRMTGLIMSTPAFWLSRITRSQSQQSTSLYTDRFCSKAFILTFDEVPRLMVTDYVCHNYVYFDGFICIISFPYIMLEIMYSTLMCVITIIWNILFTIHSLNLHFYHFVYSFVNLWNVTLW